MTISPFCHGLIGHGPLIKGGGQRLDTEVGYGLPINARFVSTPRADVRTSEYGRDYPDRLRDAGTGAAEPNLQLGIDAERQKMPSFHLQE